MNLPAGNVLRNLLAEQAPISLERCNALASMQDRIDNKYLLDFDQFQTFLEAVSSCYTVLEIDCRRQFRYASCYYDDGFRCYHEHHQGRRQRMKVRTRKYIDGGGLMYFEIKLKGPRGRTVKHRSPTPSLVSQRIEGTQLAMVQDLYGEQYGKRMSFELCPALMVGYRRCTLVATDGGERVTIDSELSFVEPGGRKRPVRVGTDFIIVETKSSKGKGRADSALRNLGIRKASKCSKYCIGVNLTGAVEKNNVFLPTIRRARRNLRVLPV